MQSLKGTETRNLKDYVDELVQVKIPGRLCWASGRIHQAGDGYFIHPTLRSSRKLSYDKIAEYLHEYESKIASREIIKNNDLQLINSSFPLSRVESVTRYR